MTQVLTKLKSNQFSYASDAALVTGPPEERKKRKAAPEKAAKKKGKRSKKDSDDAGCAPVIRVDEVAFKRAIYFRMQNC